MDNKDKEHPLTLKVMRLTRPSLFPGVSVTCDARDLPADLLNCDMRQDIAVPSGLPHTGIGQVLLLPQSFGNIYLGETFSCCVCVHNNSDKDTQQVTIKAVLQIGSERVSLLGGSGDDASLTLSPDTVTSDTIHHEVKDVGTHILVCAVTYQSSSGETLSFRKFYKFQVMKPIDIKTRFLNAEFGSEVFVEAGVENITSGPICLEKVALEPSPLYTAVAVDTLYPGLKEGGRSVFGGINVLQPRDTRQYLYCLQPKKGTAATSSSTPPNTIGKLDIVWRTSLGDKGRLQTSHFVRSTNSAPTGDISVTVTSLPADVTLELPVAVTLAVHNNSARPQDLGVEYLSGDGGCEWHDAVTTRLMPLPPHTDTALTMTLMPLRLGMQSISGVRLRDLSNPSYVMDVGNLGRVCVGR